MRIKVTGYLNTDDLPDEYVDTSHEMGLSAEGYEAITLGTSGLGLDMLDGMEFNGQRD